MSNLYYPYIMPTTPALPRPKEIVPQFTNMSKPFKGERVVYFYPYSYPYLNGGAFTETYYRFNQFRTPYFPFGPYKVGPYY